MKYNTLRIIPFLILIYITFSSVNNIKAHTLDEIVAIVNKDIILASDIKNTQVFGIKYNENYFHNQKNYKHLSKKEILNQLIIDKLILQLAKRTNVRINNDQVNNIINYIASENHMTTKELKSYFKSNNINYDDYVNNIKNNTIINTICEYEMHQRIKILPYELHKLTRKLMLEDNNIAFQLNHILIPLQENATKYQIKQAYLLSTFLAREMKYGTNINKLATLYSNNKTIPTIQIEKTHWKTIEELPTLFSEHLIKEEIYLNKVVGPIHSHVGFHILKIHDIDDHTKKNATKKIFHTRHIFITTSNINNDIKIQKQLLQVTERIKNNDTTFSIEAQQISEDQESSYNGGDLGWKYLEDFDKTSQNTIQLLKKGEITKPIKTNYGWHIIQLIDTEQIDANEIFYQKHAYQIIFNKKLHNTMNHWIQELKTLTYIKIFKNDNQ